MFCSPFSSRANLSLPMTWAIGATVATLTCLCQRVMLPGRGASAVLTAGLDAFLADEPIERMARRIASSLAGSADVLVVAEDGTPLAASHPALNEAARGALAKIHGGVERPAVDEQVPGCGVGELPARLDDGVALNNA